MKKALVIFAVGLSLIMVGGLVTFSEFSTWNQNEETFEDNGYQTKTISATIDIKKYQKSSIVSELSFNNIWFDSLFSELESKIIVDKNQSEGSLEYNVTYYPEFGECEIFYDNNKHYNNINFHPSRHNMYYNDDFYRDDKIYLNVGSSCYKDYFNNRFFMSYFIQYDNFKLIMKLKKFPFNVQQITITINPNDQDKLIK